MIDIEKEGYQFGDVTKNVATLAGRKISGKEDYEFGDITRDNLSAWNETLRNMESEMLRDANISSLLQNWLNGLDIQQRNALIFNVIRIAAVALLTWGLISNICTILAVNVSWAHSSFTHAISITGKFAAEGKKGAGTGAANSAFASTIFKACKEHRDIFWETYRSLRLFMDPFFLVVQGGGTVRFFFTYQRFIQHIEQTWMSSNQRKRYPRLHRLAALGIAFFLTHVLCSFIVSLTFMALVSEIIRFQFS